MYKTKNITNTRIEIADALRGIAVMGIVIFHSLENFNVFCENKSMTLPSDSIVGTVCETLFAGKMYGIFALLFGLSFFIMRDNQEQKGNDFSLRFAWRMVLLFVIGMVNMAIYNGDILTFYAILGLLMIPMAYLPSRWLWALTMLILLQPIELYCYFTGTDTLPSDLWENYGRMGEANTNGTFIDSCLANLQYGLGCNFGWFFWKGRLTQTFGFFLLGILVGRHRLLYNEDNNLKIWQTVLMASLTGVILFSAFDFGSFAIWAAPVTNMFILLLEVSAIVLLWYRWDRFKKLLSNVCFFGRMSMSNYLLQSIFGAIIFYGWGFGMCHYLGNTWSLLVGIGIITLQILILKQWNKSHQRGPMETLWRNATWMKFGK